MTGTTTTSSTSPGTVKEVAEKKNKGYQTLLKEFVVERLYEEEKREGVLR